jgi:hypothetical protein
MDEIKPKNSLYSLYRYKKLLNPPKNQKYRPGTHSTKLFFEKIGFQMKFEVLNRWQTLGYYGTVYNIYRNWAECQENIIVIIKIMTTMVLKGYLKELTNSEDRASYDIISKKCI